MTTENKVSKSENIEKYSILIISIDCDAERKVFYVQNKHIEKIKSFLNSVIEENDSNLIDDFIELMVETKVFLNVDKCVPDIHIVTYES